VLTYIGNSAATAIENARLYAAAQTEIVERRRAEQEVFGPVLVATPFADEGEAIRLANGTAYGLVAGVHTRNIDAAMRMSEELPPAEDAFASGGSVGHFSGADCAEGGLVVYSTAEPREDQYTVERRFLRTEEGAFVYDSSRDERHRLAFEEIPVRFGEFRFTPFGSCG
jgi:hypothetical protein